MLCAVRPAPALLRVSAAAHRSRQSIRTSASNMAGGGAASLVYPKPIVFDALQQAKSCLIMLHGLGDSGQGWADVAPMLQPDLPQTKFIFPTAPIRPITINGGMRMTGWYDIADLDRIGSESQDAAAMHESRRYIDELVEQEVAGGIPSSSIVVGGFSQGGAMALMSLRSKHKLAGIIGLSCYLPLLEEKPIVSDENKDTPVLMCHGDCDDVVNYNFGKRSFEELQKAGVNVDFKTYQYMGHEACGEELMEMRDFLKSCFSKAAGKL